MKILMLTWEYPPRIVGGIAKVVYDLSKRLIKDGHEVTVVTYREGDVPYYENDKGVEVYRVDNYMINPNNFIDWIMQLNFNLIAKTSEIINKNGKFDIIHAHDWLVANAAKTLKASYDIPLVATIHATESGRNGGIRDEQQRGFQYLIDAAPKILNGYHDAKFIIAGKGGMLNELKAKANYLGISDKVYFTGQLTPKELYTMYRCADIAVFPSTYEPFGLVAIEGMYAGTPIVVSDVGGLNEIVEHGITGMKSYSGNPNSIADSILALLFDYQLAYNIAKNGKAKVKETYNWTKIAQDTHFIYQKSICETVAEKQAREIEQERAKKTKKLRQSNLINFIKQETYA